MHQGPVIDVTRLAARLLEGTQATGVDRVSLAYLRHFRGSARALVRHWGRWALLDGRDSARMFAALLHELPEPRQIVRATVLRSLLRTWDAAPGCVLFNTGHSGLDLPDYAQRIRRRGLRPVYFLHDLLPLTHPEFFREGEAALHRRRLRTMAETGHGLLLNSSMTEEDMTHHARVEGLRLPRHAVAPLCPEVLPAPMDEAPTEQPYFVMVGTIEPRKNHLLLLHVWRRLAQLGLPTMPRLVLIGRRGWECEQVIDMLERCEALRPHVLEIANCNDRELSTWLRHARALLYPSFVEGFGLPLVEALAHGVPVVASTLPVFQEVAGDIPDYVDALDGPGWAACVQEYLQPQSSRRAAQLARLRHYAPRKWAEHFAVVQDLLDTMRVTRLQHAHQEEQTDA